MLATFLPWGHFPIIGSISGDAGEVGWTTLCCFIPAIVLALAGTKFEPLIGIARLAAAIPAGIAGSIGLYKIYQFKSIANRIDPDNPLEKAMAASFGIGVGLYLLVAAGAALVAAAWILAKLPPMSDEPDFDFLNEPSVTPDRPVEE